MSLNPARQPRGIRTGGQFAAKTQSEGDVTLGGSAFQPGHSRSQPPGLRGAQEIDGQWVPESEVNYEPEAGTMSRRPRRNTATSEAVVTAPTLGERFDDITDHAINSKLAGKAEENFNKVADTVEAAGVSFAAARNAPVSEQDGSFVGWGQVLPRLLRRK